MPCPAGPLGRRLEAVHRRHTLRPVSPYPVSCRPYHDSRAGRTLPRSAPDYATSTSAPNPVRCRESSSTTESAPRQWPPCFSDVSRPRTSSRHGIRTLGKSRCARRGITTVDPSIRRCSSPANGRGRQLNAEIADLIPRRPQTRRPCAGRRGLPSPRSGVRAATAHRPQRAGPHPAHKSCGNVG